MYIDTSSKSTNLNINNYKKIGTVVFIYICYWIYYNVNKQIVLKYLVNHKVLKPEQAEQDKILKKLKILLHNVSVSLVKVPCFYNHQMNWFKMITVS